MIEEQFYLLKVSEEALEIIEETTQTAHNVAKRAMKAMQFGMDECQVGDPLDNADRLKAELNDLIGCVELLNEKCNFRFVPDRQAIDAKKDKVETYKGYSEKLGMVK